MERREGGKERGGERKNVTKSFLFTKQEDKILVPKFYISQTWAFSVMQVPQQEVCTLKIKSCTDDRIHKKPNQNVLTIVVVVVIVVMFLESYLTTGASLSPL